MGIGVSPDSLAEIVLRRWAPDLGLNHGGSQARQLAVSGLVDDVSCMQFAGFLGRLRR